MSNSEDENRKEYWLNQWKKFLDQADNEEAIKCFKEVLEIDSLI